MPGSRIRSSSSRRPPAPRWSRSRSAEPGPSRPVRTDWLRSALALLCPIMGAAENSFDIACKLDMQEVANAINQAQREIETRYDLKGAKNEIKQEKMLITLTS